MRRIAVLPVALPPRRCPRLSLRPTLRTETTSGTRRWKSDGRLSIDTGHSSPPLLQSTIPEHFASIVALHGDAPAITAHPPTSSASPSSLSRPTTLSYHALDLLSNRLAHALQSPPFSILPGDRIAVSLGNTAEFAALTYACFKLGAVLVPLNPGFNAAQVTAALAHLGARMLVVGAVTDLSYKPGRGRANADLLRAVLADDGAGVPELQHVVVVDNTSDHPGVRAPPLDTTRPSSKMTPFDELLLGSAASVTPSRPLRADDVINIQFTSGTTSTPKAAMLTHHAILNNGHLIAARMTLRPSDRIVLPPPLFHCFGCILGYMATATTGAHLIFPSPAFDPLATLRACVAHDATGLYGVSTMLVAMMELLESGAAHAPRPADLPRGLRKGIMAGSSVPEAVMAKAQRTFGLDDVVICYGMTETSPVSCMTSPSDPPSARATTVGRVMPHTTVKVVDPADRTRILPRGRRGELATSGYLLMKGYFGDEQRTAEVMRREHPSAESGGRWWIYTGDEAVMDAAGFVKITGRIKDLIIRGGENIHPLEVEDCLFRMPGVSEVSVVGVPDDKLGEAVAAFVILKAGWRPRRAQDEQDAGGNDAQGGVVGEDAVRDWVRTRLSSHLVPKYVFWVAEYPKTASGKIQKFKLRAQAVDALGLKEP